jgi:ribosomal protein S18 acetylase RimI-like enzyme
MAAVDPEPRRPSAQEVTQVVDILVSAFYLDPTWMWAFPDPDLRAEQHRRVWTILVESALHYPWVWLTEGNTATSVWIPPGGVDLSEEGGVALERAVNEILGPDAGRVMEGMERFEQARPHDVPHYYLTLIGTNTANRGHGYGLGLLADNLRHIDQERMPCYLEASNPANVDLYGRHGFEVVGSITMPSGGPEVATMWRDPSPAA